VGLGNIGSHLATLVGRNEAVGRLVLIDFDSYAEDNLSTQAIQTEDIGEPKTLVQARRVERIRPSLTVETLCARVQDVPLPRLRGDVILTGLDSRSARQHVNEAAWRLGVPWIDAAVDGPGLLVRVAVYVPGLELPCLECAWDDSDYQALEQAYPCQPGSGAPPASNSPASVGACAAALAAVECQKLLRDRDRLLGGREVLLDLNHHTHFLTALRRNPRCRFDHEVRAGLRRTEFSFAGALVTNVATS
jgi:adenylyltransferase/sulfurtransferase